MTTADKRDKLIQMAIDTDVVVDRWDNIKWNLASGKQMRLNIKKIVIRTEVKYNDGLGWTRINSVNISRVNVAKWQVNMNIIYNEQNGYGECNE